MEREILYRGKRKDNGEWIESLTLFQLDKNLYMLQTAWADITYDLQYNITAILGRKKPFLVEVIPSTVGRYTGLTDKNGVEIFEGDVVRTQYGRLCVVIWHQTDCHCGWDLYPVNDDHKPPSKWCAFNSDCLEVVANIHDNPDMLKGEDLKNE